MPSSSGFAGRSGWVTLCYMKVELGSKPPNIVDWVHDARLALRHLFAIKSLKPRIPNVGQNQVSALIAESTVQDRNWSSYTSEFTTFCNLLHCCDMACSRLSGHCAFSDLYQGMPIP